MNISLQFLQDLLQSSLDTCKQADINEKKVKKIAVSNLKSDVMSHIHIYIHKDKSLIFKSMSRLSHFVKLGPGI